MKNWTKITSKFALISLVLVIGQHFGKGKEKERAKFNHLIKYYQLLNA
jgi:hypothetical protein